MDFGKLEQQHNESPKTSLPRTAILWGPGDMLGRAIESILDAVNHWRVVRIADDYDVRTLAREMEKTRPEIVFVNLGDCSGDFLSPIRLMEDSPELKIITFNPDNNLIGVYSRQVIQISRTSDLWSIIGGQFSPKQEGGGTENAEKQSMSDIHQSSRLESSEQEEIK